jgi:hypothetical protein
MCVSAEERLKYVTTWAVANYHLSTFQCKPFTPLLGETLQQRIGDLDVYFENTMSKPPTINFYCVGNNYKIYGYLPVAAETGLNSVTAKKRGTVNIELSIIDEKGNKIKDMYRYFIPKILINGVLTGKRTFNFCSPMVIQSESSKLSSFLHFNPDKRSSVFSMIGLSQKTFPDYAKGYICDSSLIKIDEKNLDHTSKAKSKNYKCDLDAEWSNFCRFGQTKYWSKEEYKIPKIQKQFIGNDSNNLRYILKSDSSFRKDLITFNDNRQEESQLYKEAYEQRQRNDRGFRRKWIEGAKLDDVNLKAINYKKNPHYSTASFNVAAIEKSKNSNEKLVLE